MVIVFVLWMQPLTFQFWTLLPDRNISNEIKVYVKKIISPLFLLTVKVQYGQLSEKSGVLKFLVFNLFKRKNGHGCKSDSIIMSSCFFLFQWSRKLHGGVACSNLIILLWTYSSNINHERFSLSHSLWWKYIQ